MRLIIREAGKSDAEPITAILRAAFGPVAIEFGLTSENCPSHTSFATPDWVVQDLDHGVPIFVGADGGMPVACVVLRMQAEKGAKLKRLAVLPEFQGRGIGRKLIAHAESVAKRNAFEEVEIGIMAEHTSLLEWYRKQGYVESHQAAFPQLPFTVQYMTKKLSMSLL